MGSAQAVISVYMDDGRVFDYPCAGLAAREHASEIIKGGYRSAKENVLEWFPPHRIRKVKIVGDIGTAYPDSVRGT